MVEVSKQEDKEQNSFSNWIDRIYKKFTIIGIFGGLSVYLTQIPSEITVAIQAGIAGSLLVFSIITALIILEGMEKALEMANKMNPDMFLYIFTVVGLVGILIAVLSVMDRFSQGATPLIDAATTVGVSLYYIAYFFFNNPFSKIEPDNLLHRAMAYSPHIAGGWMFLTELANKGKGESLLTTSISWDPYIRGY